MLTSTDGENQVGRTRRGGRGCAYRLERYELLSLKTMNEKAIRLVGERKGKGSASSLTVLCLLESHEGVGTEDSDSAREMRRELGHKVSVPPI